MKKLNILPLSLICLIMLLPAHSFSQVKSKTGNNNLNDADKFQNKDLPEGVTQDWINSLTDENGKRIITETKHFNFIKQYLFLLKNRIKM